MRLVRKGGTVVTRPPSRVVERNEVPVYQLAAVTGPFARLCTASRPADDVTAPPAGRASCLPRESPSRLRTRALEPRAGAGSREDPGRALSALRGQRGTTIS